MTNDEINALLTAQDDKIAALTIRVAELTELNERLLSVCERVNAAGKRTDARVDALEGRDIAPVIDGTIL